MVLFSHNSAISSRRSAEIGRHESYVAGHGGLVGHFKSFIEALSRPDKAY